MQGAQDTLGTYHEVKRLLQTREWKYIYICIYGMTDFSALRCATMVLGGKV